MFKGLEHYGIAAKDPAKLVEWYCDVLGMKFIRQADELTYFISDEYGSCIEIYKADNQVEGKFNNKTQGLTHTAILTDDYDNDYKMLIDMGIRPADEPIYTSVLKLALFFDIEGNLFHIVQRSISLVQR